MPDAPPVRVGNLLRRSEFRGRNAGSAPLVQHELFRSTEELHVHIPTKHREEHPSAELEVQLRHICAFL